MSGEKVLVTGTAGFIGFHFARRLQREGYRLVGMDAINDYYDVRIKYARLRELGLDEKEIEDLASGRAVRLEKPGHTFYRIDLVERERVAEIFRDEKPDFVVHLAAQAGVRYSLENPYAYVGSNLLAFAHVLEGCRHGGVRHLVFASSSSVYGSNRAYPFSEHQGVDHPVSLYAATKKSNELMAHAYAHLFGLPATGLRFFTVYGPWGRPDMALFLFTERILRGEPIDLFNGGEMKRDFTYIDDVVEGMLGVLTRPPKPDPSWDGSTKPDPATSSAPYRIFNIGNGRPVPLLSFVALIERALGRKAVVRKLPMQPGDVAETSADVADLERHLGLRAKTTVEEGVERFVEWYKSFYGVGG